MTGLPVPAILISKPVFLASNKGPSILASIDDALKLVELGRRRERKSLG